MHHNWSITRKVINEPEQAREEKEKLCDAVSGLIGGTGAQAAEIRWEPSVERLEQPPPNTDAAAQRPMSSDSYDDV